MCSFSVQLRREYLVETYADVEVVAESASAAVRIALAMADAEQVPDLAHHDGEERTTFAQTRDAHGNRVSGHNG